MSRIIRFFCAAGIATVFTLGFGGSALAQNTTNPMDTPDLPCSECGAGWQ